MEDRLPKLTALGKGYIALPIAFVDIKHSFLPRDARRGIGAQILSYAVVLTLMRAHYYCVYLYNAALVDVLMHAVDLHKTASR